MAVQQVHAIMGLDIGEQRTGVALANSVANIATPLTTISQPDLIQRVKQLIDEHEVSTLVVGLPRNLSGHETSQTQYVQQIAHELEKQVKIPIHFIDEAATSIRAEDELKLRKKPYRKEDIDMLAATYILEDFLRDLPKEYHV